MRNNLFRPNKTTPHAQQTSTGTADVKSFAKPASANGLFITVETNGAYITFDGTAPSATNGLFLPTGVVHFLPLTLDFDPQVASSAAGNAKCNVVWAN